MQKTLFMFMLFSASCLFAENEIGQIETLMGFSFQFKGAEFNVESGGCTTKNDFVLVGNSKCEISLRRIHQDNCEAYLPFGTPVFFEKKEIEKAVENYRCSSVRFSNPINSTMRLY